MRSINYFRNRNPRHRNTDDEYNMNTERRRTRNYGDRYDRVFHYPDESEIIMREECELNYRGKYGRNYSGRHHARNKFERGGRNIGEAWNDWTASNAEHAYDSRIKRHRNNGTIDTAELIDEYSRPLRKRNRSRELDSGSREGTSVWNEFTKRRRRREYGYEMETQRNANETNALEPEDNFGYFVATKNKRGKSRNVVKRGQHHFRQTRNEHSSTYNDRNRRTYQLDDLEYEYGIPKKIAELWI